jgi:hypothetical protein
MRKDGAGAPRGESDFEGLDWDWQSMVGAQPRKVIAGHTHRARASNHNYVILKPGFVRCVIKPLPPTRSDVI